ncbi:MAG: hypothetical protein HY275_00835 [Gemmatimonadetes bacterium]|nr:hypothetical protein [Gemmatimonadota bacterium]
MTKRTPLERKAQYIGIGCLTTAGGAFGGAMVAVLIAKVVGLLSRCEPVEGLPACDWHIFAGWGALIGVAILPTAALWRVRQSHAAEDAQTGD